VRRLLDAARRWLAAATGGRPDLAVRHHEVEEIRKRLDELER
jgi:hypothetical protein